MVPATLTLLRIPLLGANLKAGTALAQGGVAVLGLLLGVGRLRS